MTRRILAGFMFLLASMSGMVPTGPTASAQNEPSVRLTLLSQSAWTAARRPLDVSFQATNLSSAALQALSVELLIQAPARSRSLYELSIRSDPTPIISAYPFPQEGTLEPGQSRTFRIRQEMSQLVVRGESALYPLRVELRSEDLPVGILRTPMIFLIERPEVPLNLAWTWVLSEPLQYNPDGVFQPGTIESAIAPGGRLDSLVEALSIARGRALDLVVSPTLLDQLRRMSGGYRIARRPRDVRIVPKGVAGAADAERVLSRLREVASRPEVELIAYPMGDPSLPALLRAGMTGDLDKLTEEGQKVVASVLGRQADSTVARTPASALDPLTVPKLVSSGAGTALVDPNFVTFAKFGVPPTARLTSGGSSLNGVLPDPEVESLIRASGADPRLGAQLALGELAAIWFELPGTPGRGSAVMFPENSVAPLPFYGAFVSLVRSSPWLQPSTASEFVRRIPPQIRRQVPARNYPSFSPFYMNRLEQARTVLAHLNRAVQGAQPLIDKLRHNLLLADSGAFLVDNGLGQTFIDSVYRTARRVYDRIGIATDVPLTLTSRAGSIPITLANSSGYTVTVVLEFITDRRLEFSGGSSRTIVLPPSDRTLLVGVRSLANGRIPIRVRLLTPGRFSPEVIAERGLVVRSTAYNRLALFVTIGAALFLVAWWGRRFLPRRRT